MDEVCVLVDTQFEEGVEIIGVYANSVLAMEEAQRRYKEAYDLFRTAWIKRTGRAPELDGRTAYRPLEFTLIDRCYCSTFYEIRVEEVRHAVHQ